MDNSFDGKVVLVTGGATGIGRAACVAFGKAGAKVAVVDVNSEDGEDTAQLVSESGSEAIFVRADVSDGREAEAMVQATVKTLGRLDCAFNNAGISGEFSLVAEGSEEVWDRVIAVNLKGVWQCMRFEIPHMKRQGGGAIVNMASVAGLVGSPRMGAYVAAKHGVIGLTKTAALENARNNIRVNALSPGWTDTAIIEPIFSNEDLGQRLTAAVPMKRLGTPEEIAAAAVWLCSGAASFVTAHTLVADGGLTAQ